MIRPLWHVAAVVALWAGAGAALAAPADDYQRGLQAYRRGDVAAAMASLRSAAQTGHAPSHALLAFILDRADFSDEAAQHYRAAAERGDAEGHAGLAQLYATGRGIAKDEKQALAHFSKAAELGHAGAIDVVALAYLRGQWGLDAQGRDAVAAVAAWRRAAAQGHLAATEALAQVYTAGRPGVPADPAEAGRWRQRATELGQRAVAAAAASAPRP